MMTTKNRENIIDICSLLAQQENLTVTIHESGKGALIAGMGVFIGGILGGPAGMAVGGTITSIIAACSSKGKFKSVVEIIDEMNDDQQRRLSEAVKKAIQNIKPEDYIGALTLALSTPSIKDVILKELGSFLMKELQVKMIR